MFKPSRLVLYLFAVLLCGAGAPAQSAGMDRASGKLALRVVDDFHAVLLDVMKNAKALGVKGRYERLAPEIARRFDSQLMIALATGRYWRRAAPAQRQTLVSAFRRLSTATYAARFTGYSGQKFELLSVEPGPRKTLIVQSRIVEPRIQPVALNYVLRNSATGWRIVDVLVKSGISELAVRRSEYRAILKSGGIPRLISSLKAKATRLLGR
ncbi:MAG: ABC transporter substrate-binding protein [Alphaproteobacteria bacterium]